MMIPAYKQKGTTCCSKAWTSPKEFLARACGRAYTNLGSGSVKIKDYVFGKEILGEGNIIAKRESSTPGKHICLPARLPYCSRPGCWRSPDLAGRLLKKGEPGAYR